LRVPYEWLKEFVVMDMEPHELAKRLTMRGLEVESVEEHLPHFEGVTAGKIISVEEHPQANNLSLCKVDVGREVLSVVCGARNVSAGDIVPVATVGARLVDGTVVENREIRGVISPGMLCSEKELGLSDDHTGIFILENNIKIGEQLRDVDSFSDFVLDINVSPNRGDCSSIYGIAREVASILDQKARIMSFDYKVDEKENIDDYVALEVLNMDACPRYVLMMIKGIRITKSPYWMRSRLIKCGMRPINSIVDVTNYVMLELGQPLHAFDYGKLRAQKIEVRLTEAETIFRTLDGEDRKLDAGDLLICDGAGPVAIAGIMGGENSEIGSDTKDVALESALFNPLFIRKTSRRLGLKSEASLRFEKGVDVDSVQFSGERAIFLMNKLSGGMVVSGKKELYKKKDPKQIFVSYGKINDILGVTIEHRDIVSALRSIDLYVVKEEEEGFLVSIPAFRYDINEYMDIIEEVARIYGYEHVPATTPVTALKTLKGDKSDQRRDSAKDYLRSAGFYEIINFAFFGTKDIENFLIPPEDGKAACVKILNPLSKEYGVMRTFIAAGLLKNIGYNLNRGSNNLKFFEMGKVFSVNGEGVRSEFPSVCMALSGKERDYFWREPFPEYDFFDLKGIVEGLLEDFGLKPSFVRTGEPFLNDRDSADVFIDGAKIGWVGEIKEEVLKPYEIEQKVYCAELRFDIISKTGKIESKKYRPIPRYPQVVRDFSFFIDEEIPVSLVIGKIEKASPLITSVGVFDMFKKEERSIALRVTFQSYEDTLTDEEVNSLQEAIIKEITSVNGITLRT
jgi:phenylalanyl-tRNA synthetase beta chain